LAAVDRDRPWQLVQNLSTLFVLATAADWGWSMLPVHTAVFCR
jgi:hypothetical protein